MRWFRASVAELDGLVDSASILEHEAASLAKLRAIHADLALINANLDAILKEQRGRRP
jgi:hypothetical protein